MVSPEKLRDNQIQQSTLKHWIHWYVFIHTYMHWNRAGQRVYTFSIIPTCYHVLLYIYNIYTACLYNNYIYNLRGRKSIYLLRSDWHSSIEGKYLGYRADVEEKIVLSELRGEEVRKRRAGKNRVDWNADTQKELRGDNQTGMKTNIKVICPTANKLSFDQAWYVDGLCIMYIVASYYSLTLKGNRQLHWMLYQRYTILNGWKWGKRWEQR